MTDSEKEIKEDIKHLREMVRSVYKCLIFMSWLIFIWFTIQTLVLDDRRDLEKIKEYIQELKCHHRGGYN